MAAGILGQAKGIAPANGDSRGAGVSRALGRGAGGFTLAEVMIASTIFMIFCVFFLSSVIVAMRSQRLACDYYTAMTIARNRIQRAKTFEFASLPLMTENLASVDGNGNLVSGGLYQRTTQVTAYTNGTPNLYHVTVQVHYIGARRVRSAQPVEISTLVAERM